MKITLGEWKTRDGRKAIVAAYNPNAQALRQFIGWVDGSSYSWTVDGSWLGDEDQHLDLIAPWTDPVPWDWSTTPPWCVCLVLGPAGCWFLCDQEVFIGNDGIVFADADVMCLPDQYAPKWSGDWKLSKTMRPKEVAK